jgi:hypothetical protein
MVSEETKKKWKDKLETILGSYNNCCIELNEWEKNFINNISILLDEPFQELSFKQSKCLNRIYEKCT